MLSELYPDAKLMRIVSLFEEHRIPYAVGGAIALFYWGEPTATAHTDINVFLATDEARWVVEVLSASGIGHDSERAIADIAATAQTRIDYDGVPVDLFFADLPFHDSCAARTVRVPFDGSEISVLSPEDLVVCKAMFNRAKDWLDIEQLLRIRGRRFDSGYVDRWLSEMLGEGHPQLDHFRSLATDAND